MTSFPLVQKNSTTGTESNTLGSAITSGDILVVSWAAGGGGNPTLATSQTDNNSNVYDLVSPTYDGSPSQATTALYVCVNPILTPHNPPTITFTGATNVGSGGPSITFMEFGVPTNYSIFGAICNQEGGNLYLYEDQASGVGLSETISLTATGNNEAGAQACLILENQFSDILVIYQDYDYQSAGPTWSTTGTIIDQSSEYGSAVVCSLSLEYSSDVCGYTAISANCNDPLNGIVGKSYTHTFSVTGGTPPYTWSLTAGSFPPGLTLDASTGVLSGTPTTAGSWWFTLQVEDADDNTATITCSIGICSGTNANVAYYSRH